MNSATPSTRETPAQPFRLDNRHAPVTAGASGIGEASAKELVRTDAFVHIAEINLPPRHTHANCIHPISFNTPIILHKVRSFLSATGACMDISLEAARRFYAEDLRFTARMSSLALFEAFATVPRERFVGPGPWRVMSQNGYWTTEDTDPRHVYHNVLIALDETKSINNGQPSLWALVFDQLRVRPNDHVLHLGCGTGYYTAILAELAGPQGRVTAVEIDAALAERARLALAPWPQVSVLHADGASGPFEPADVIVASAGATHPQPSWLAALKPAGKLLFPLAPAKGPGAMALLSRITQDNFAARLNFGTYFIPFSGACDPAVAGQLAEALARDQGKSIKSLRCDPHDKDDTCWLHGDAWCFSTREPAMLD
jgi:protein-L-isoaspartate(D-aspartate) O-methyltransferase